jgi:hypothetical protein
MTSYQTCSSFLAVIIFHFMASFTISICIIWNIFISWLNLQGIPVAPLWDSFRGQFVGLLSPLDFILILREVSFFWLRSLRLVFFFFVTLIFFCHPCTQLNVELHSREDFTSSLRGFCSTLVVSVKHWLDNENK